jgi:type III secretion protein J
MSRLGRTNKRAGSANHGPAGWLVVFALFSCLLSGCKEELFGKVDESDANAALNVLYGEGINATKLPVEGEFWRIEVESKDLQRALHATRKQGVPRERFANMGDLFKKEGLVATPSETRMRYLFAVSQELSNTLSHIDGVISARVHPVIPVHDPLAEKVLPASAAVFIKHLPDADVQQMAPAIRALVARSIEGLSVDNVSLTFFASRLPAVVAPLQPTALLSESVVAALAWLLGLCFVLCLALFAWQAWNRRNEPRVAALAPRQVVRR